MQVVKPLEFNPFSFERASTASYFDDTGTLVWAAIDEPRYGYNPVTLEATGLIIESAATNYALRSNEFDHSLWEAVGSTSITQDAPDAPTGVDEAYWFQWTSGTSMIRQSIGLTYPAGSSLVFSVFLRAQNPDCTVRLNLGGATSVFRINDGDYSALSSSAKITPAGNSWYRCELLLKNAGTSFSGYISIQASNGNFFMYGAQLERSSSTFGNTATSYIISVGASGTRAADIVVSQSPSVVSTNIIEDDNPVWDSGTSYTIGQAVMVLGQYHRNYKALTANTNKNPPDNPADWLDTGATNPWRMFDMKVGADLQSVNDGDINFTLSFDEKIKDVCLFNLLGTSVNIKMYSGSEVVYEQTVDLTLPVSESSYWEFYFENRRKIKDVAFVDLPPVTYSSIEINVDGGGASTAIGKCVVGYGEYLGFAEYGTTSIGIVDYSTKERDDFGNYYVQERRYAGTMNVRPVVEPGNETRVRDILAECRATSSAYIVEAINGEQILTLGFFKDFDVLFSTPAASYCTLTLEAI